MMAAGMVLLAALAMLVIKGEGEQAEREEIERIREEQRRAPRRRRERRHATSTSGARYN